MGGYTQIDAVLTLIKQVNCQSVQYQYVHFLQGSDLPIKTQDEIHAYFNENLGKEFVMVEKGRTNMAIYKTEYRHFFCHNRYFRKNKFMKFLNFGLVYAQKLFHIKKKIGIKVFQGSALFSITGECARYIEESEKSIHKLFRYSLAADEVFLQTILMDSNFKDRIAGIENENSENARLIDRTRPDGKNSPHVWRTDEFDFIINQPKEKCFARKFDENVDIDIVEKIHMYLKG